MWTIKINRSEKWYETISVEVKNLKKLWICGFLKCKTINIFKRLEMLTQSWISKVTINIWNLFKCVINHGKCLAALVGFPTKCHFKPVEVLDGAIFQFPCSENIWITSYPKIIIKTITNNTDTSRSRWMCILHTDMKNHPPLIPFTKSPELQCASIKFRYNVDLWMRKWEFSSVFNFIFLLLQRYRKPEMCFTL